jgi:hypothetical protein
MAATQIVTFAERWAKVLRRRKQWALATVVVAAAALLLWAGYHLVGRLRGPRVARPENLAAYFPDAPESYGVADPESRPFPVEPDRNHPPAFSWISRVNPGQFKFVASRSGRHFYALDDPRAVLIRAEDVIGYRSTEAAVADGKSAAP